MAAFLTCVSGYESYDVELLLWREFSLEIFLYDVIWFFYEPHLIKQMSNVLLLARETNPVVKAVESVFESDPLFQRLNPEHCDQVKISDSDILIIGEPFIVENPIFNQIRPAFVHFLNCRISIPFTFELFDAQIPIAGISPVLSQRVANRVFGFAGPLQIKPDAEWGIIGIGDVGFEVSRNLISSGATVGVADIRTPRARMLTELNVRRQSLDLLLSGSDAVSIHIYPGPTACPLISEREINLMRPGAVLVNTSDPSVVKDDDVLKALSNGLLAGYATDCPSDEISGADRSLVSSGRLLITTNPLTNQIGAAQQIAKHVHSNVQSFRAGEEIMGRVEPIDFPTVGDPSFWSSRMSPRQ